jgi:hypothetical protein
MAAFGRLSLPKVVMPVCRRLAAERAAAGMAAFGRPKHEAGGPKTARDV